MSKTARGRSSRRPLTGSILWAGALHPATIGPHCLPIVPRSNISSAGGATTLRAALPGRKGRRAARVCIGTPIVPEMYKCNQMYWINQNMPPSERGGIYFGAARPADPSARARARARARFRQKMAPGFSRWKSPEQKHCKFVAQMCPMDTSG